MNAKILLLGQLYVSYYIICRSVPLILVVSFISLPFNMLWVLLNDILKWHWPMGWRCHSFQT